MRFGILGSPDSWHVRDLQRAAAGCARPPVEIVPLAFASLSAQVHTEGCEVAAGEHPLGHWDGVLVRSMPPGSLEQVIFRMDTLHALRQAGCAVVNPPRALETAIDKYLSLSRLQRARLPVPATRVTQDAHQALEAFRILGGDVVVKPLFGSEGRGMVRVSDPEMAQRVFRALEQIQAVMYVQQFIPNAGGDLRLLVVGQRIWGMRRWCQGNWRANLAQGGRGERLEVTDELAGLARSATAAVGAQVAAVDLLPAHDGTHYVLEVNAVPGWKGLARVLQVDIAHAVLQFMVEQRHASF